MIATSTIWAFSVNPPTKAPLRAKFNQQQLNHVEARLRVLLDDITAAAHTVNVCALNLKSARALRRRSQVWLAIGLAAGLALGIVAAPLWPL